MEGSISCVLETGSGKRDDVEEGEVELGEKKLLSKGPWSNTLLMEEVSLVPDSCPLLLEEVPGEAKELEGGFCGMELPELNVGIAWV